MSWMRYECVMDPSYKRHKYVRIRHRHVRIRNGHVIYTSWTSHINVFYHYILYIIYHVHIICTLLIYTSWFRHNNVIIFFTRNHRSYWLHQIINLVRLIWLQNWPYRIQWSQMRPGNVPDAFRINPGSGLAEQRLINKQTTRLTTRD